MPSQGHMHGQPTATEIASLPGLLLFPPPYPRRFLSKPGTSISRQRAQVRMNRWFFCWSLVYWPSLAVWFPGTRLGRWEQGRVHRRASSETLNEKA